MLVGTEAHNALFNCNDLLGPENNAFLHDVGSVLKSGGFLTSKTISSFTTLPSKPTSPVKLGIVKSGLVCLC